MIGPGPTQASRPAPHDAASPGAASAATRNGAVDALRLAAAVVIVLFHADAPGGSWMSAAMGVFTALLTYYVANGARDGLPALGAIRARAGRLLLPFLLWFAISVALLTADALVGGQDPWGDLRRWLPWTGTMGQLWFLPWAFVVSLVVMALHPLARRAHGGAALGLIAAVAALIHVVDAEGTLRPWSNGTAVLLAYLPAAGFGWAIALQRTRPGRLVAFALLSILLGLLAREWAFQRQLIVGVPLVVAALLAGPVLRGLPLWVADLAMGIYLVHIAVIAIALRFLPDATTRLDLALVTLAVSAVATLMARRTAVGRVLVGAAPVRPNRL